MVTKRNYPEWFINELVDEEDKKRALSCELKSTDRIRFMCENNHIYEIDPKLFTRLGMLFKLILV